MLVDAEAAPPALPSLYVICDADACARAGWTLVDFAAACLDGGARLLQVRAKGMPGRSLLHAVDRIVERGRPLGATVVVNDRADIARLARAGGVHVGQDDLGPGAARAILGPEPIVGLSTHTTAQIDQAAGEPISYVAVGPVFGTATKDTGYDPVGVERVRYAVRRVARPIVAIGGITLDNSREILEAGATSVAVIGDLLATGHPERRVRAYLERAAGRGA